MMKGNGGNVKSSSNKARPEDRLAGMDFAQHNAEVAEMWANYHARKPKRIPIILGTNTRYFMFNGGANPQGTSFRQYIENPDVMFDCQLQFQRWLRCNLLQDAQLGMPEKWSIAPDFQNFYEAAWFGCPIEYLEGQVPDTHPAFAEAPERVMEKGLPDPFGGLFATAKAYYEHFKARAAKETFLDRPIGINDPWFGVGTDGPLTVACNLFGPVFVCEAMVLEPKRLEKLLAFIVEATINRMRAWRQYAGMPLRPENFGFADDSLALISTAMYREHVLPHHRRLCDAMAGPGPRGTHLCGDATRHFVTLRDELDIRSFDTGFPVDFGQLRRDLGPEVQIQGGPHVEFLLSATPRAVGEEVQRILGSGILAGGRFVLREGNNLAPGTPLVNTEAMYHAGREYGQISR
jgi:uroporphyrinogen-III decarboxylase